MSKVSHRVHFTTRIGKVCEKSSLGYALSNVQARPRTAGGAWLTATDARAMAIVPSESSEVPTVELVPSELTNGPTAKKGVLAELNGKWTSSNGKFAEQAAGTYPRADKVLPVIQADDANYCTFVRLDAKLLATLSEALTKPNSEQFVTLIITPDTDQYGFSTRPICVQGGEGFGVLMPVAIKKNRAEVLGEFVANCDSYRKDWGK